MKFTLSWLKEHLDTDASLDDIVHKLTMIGLEVESVEDKAKLLAPYVIAKVVEAKQHPNADRLRVCMVDTGDGKPIQVVCGAPNARTGMTGVFVPPGAFIPGKNITLAGRHHPRRREPRHAGVGVRAADLRRPRRHHRPAGRRAGRHSLTRNTPASTMPVIDINLTPNRPDCTGVNGIARDLAAADIGTFKERTPKPVKGEFPCPVSVTLDFGQTPSAVPGVRAAPRARRQERPVAGLAAEAAQGDRACARSTRWSTSPTSSPTTAAGRCTCSTPRR